MTKIEITINEKGETCGVICKPKYTEKSTNKEKIITNAIMTILNEGIKETI